MKTWKSVREDPNKSIVSWLPIFYDHLLALWHREVRYSEFYLQMRKIRLNFEKYVSRLFLNCGEV